MTDAEMEDALAKARAVQAQARAALQELTRALHEFTNALQVIWGEIDVLKIRAHTVIEDFDARFPEFKEES